MSLNQETAPVDLRCPVCGSLSGKIVFGLVQVKCRKCGLTITHRVDVNETVNVLRHRGDKPPFGA